MNILVLGAGVQGTLYGVRLARAGHNVTLIARGKRAADLRTGGAAIENVLTSQAETAHLPIIEGLPPGARADVCFVTVRCEQIPQALSELISAPGISRIVFMVNHVGGSKAMFKALGRERVVLAFPGMAGHISCGVDRYIEVTQQPTAVESDASDIIRLLRRGGFRVARVRDMDAWLGRHAVFITAVAGALYEKGGDARRLAASPDSVRAFIEAVREGWSAMDRRHIKSAPLALRAIFSWIPLPLAVGYWRRLLASGRGEYYFALHARHAPVEMAALASGVRELLGDEPRANLDRFYSAIGFAQKNFQSPEDGGTPDNLA
jgi:2-dehydropantoate 2-reductase